MLRAAVKLIAVLGAALGLGAAVHESGSDHRTAHSPPHRSTPPVGPVGIRSSRAYIQLDAVPGPVFTTGGACLASPGKCGYPDPAYGDVGVPAGTLLTPSGSLKIRRAGAVIKDLSVAGSIEVDANHVTIEDTKVSVAGGGCGYLNGCGNADITIESGVTGTRLTDDTLTNARDGTTVQDAVYNYGGAYNYGEGLYVYSQPDAAVTTVRSCGGERNIPGGGVTGSWWGPGSVRDSYLTGDIYFACQHVDVIYAPAGRLLDVQHDTLINPHGQTSDILVDASNGGAANLVVRDSFLAGGGYAIYGDAHGSSGTNTIIGNMFARCRSARARSDGGAHSCAGGADASGFYPADGAFGVAAELTGDTVWADNIWDDSGAEISP